MPLDEQLENQFIEDFKHIYSLPDKVGYAKLKATNDLLISIIDEILKDEDVFFQTIFAKISILKQKINIPRDTSILLNYFRIQFKNLNSRVNIQITQVLQLTKQGQHLIYYFLINHFNLDLKNDFPLIESSDQIFSKLKKSKNASIPFLKGLIYQIDSIHYTLLFKSEDDEEEDLNIVHFNKLHLNEVYTDSLIQVNDMFKYPFPCMLIEIEIDEKGEFYPLHIILEPDYLFDVTAIASCFDLKEGNPYQYLLKKYMPTSSSVPLLLGDIANFFLDQLISDSSLSFDYLFPLVFKNKPLSFALLSDIEVLKIRDSAKNIYANLIKTIKEDFPKQKISPVHCYLEPSFLSEKFGIQGRLDLLYEGSDKTVIIELKSGKTYHTNQYGINIPHFFQFLLYDLLIQSGSHKNKVAGFVLYAADSKSLRFAPIHLFEQQRALALRNKLLFIELSLVSLGLQKDILVAGSQLFNSLFLQISDAKGFFKTGLESFLSSYHEASIIEKKYFFSFTSFIAREHKLAKSGSYNLQNGASGQASLWLESITDKKENFDILNHLELIELKENKIRFIKTEVSAQRANFRLGDSLILYPSNNEEKFNSKFQLFKVYLISIESDEITVSLAFPQHDDSFFKQFTFWNLEHDFYDSFISFDQSIFSFLQAKIEKRNLYLGLQPPSKNESTDLVTNASYFSKMTDEQSVLLKSIINSKDYFLLWGPPGTGKTSVMIRNLVAHYYYTTDENILLIAFTNRAVDEICEAIESIGGELENSYIRIGQVQAAPTKYRKNILKVKSAHLKNRRELLILLENTRIFVSTLSSIQKNLDILSIKKFNRIIVDEASQLSDPSLAGVLTQVPHFLLIGDHNQLPGVVLQPSEQSIIRDGDLLDIGFYDLRESVFERMIRRVESLNWTWAIGRLSYQGRMHQEIMLFPSLHFYENRLNILPANTDYHKNQIISLPFIEKDAESEIEKIINSQRVCFFSTDIDLSDGSGKSNQYEARMIVQIVQFFHQYYKKQKLSLEDSEIGIITPYRAQIACIKEHLTESGLDSGHYTVDTVERYQGSARSIIIYSPCLNYSRQLNTLISKNRDGVDRKLNVAITRAKSHFIMVGNPDLLKKSTHYFSLMKYAGYTL